MNITEFAESRNKTVGAISNYIQRHKDLFKGHTKKTGNTAELDEVALEILQKKYPLPKPVEVVADTESRKELEMALKKIVALEEELRQKEPLIAQANATNRLLEDKALQLDKTEKRLDKAEKETQDLREKNESISAELERLRLENERLKSRGLFARILNKS